MHATSHFHIEELDQASRSYLYKVNLTHGRGVPGTFASIPIGWFPKIVFILGFFLFVALFTITDVLILTEPTALALLQTALFLVGLWMLVLPVRLRITQKSPRQAGYFLFLDDKYLWQCHGRRVTVLPLDTVKEYSHSEPSESKSGWVKLKTSDGLHTFGLCHASDALDIIRHLMDNWSGKRNTQELEIPNPFRIGNEKWEVKTLLTWMVVATLAYFVFRPLDISWRDDAVWESIQEIHPESGRIYWLRLYLRDPRNTHYHDQAKSSLLHLYRDKLLLMQTTRMMDHPLPDPDLFAGLETILLNMGKSLDPAILKFSLRISGDRDESHDALEKEAARIYSEALFASLGHDFVIVAGPVDPPAHIEINGDWVGMGNDLKMRFTVRYRLTPEAEPFKTVVWNESVKDPFAQEVGLAVKNLAIRTANHPNP